MKKLTTEKDVFLRVFGEEPKKAISRIERIQKLLERTEGISEVFSGYISTEKKLDSLTSKGLSSEEINQWTEDIENGLESLLKIYRNCLFLKAAFAAVTYYERRDFLRIIDSHTEAKDRIGQIRYYPKIALNDFSVNCGWNVRTDTKKSRKATHGYLSHKYLKIGQGKTEYNLKIFGNVPKPEKTMPLIEDAENVFSEVRKKSVFIQNTVKEIKKLKKQIQKNSTQKK